MPIRLTAQGDRVHLTLKVVPGSSSDRIVGPLGDALKVTVSKPPQGGAANDAVRRLVAKAMGISSAQIEITRGHGSPRKQLSISGVGVEEVRRKLQDEIVRRSS